MSHTQSPRDIFAEHHGRQAVDGVIGQIDNFLLALEFDHYCHGSENLLPDDLHVGFDVGEDSWEDEIPSVALFSTTGD